MVIWFRLVGFARCAGIVLNDLHIFRAALYIRYVDAVTDTDAVNCYLMWHIQYIMVGILINALYRMLNDLRPHSVALCAVSYAKTT